MESEVHVLMLKMIVDDLSNVYELTISKDRILILQKLQLFPPLLSILI